MRKTAKKLVALGLAATMSVGSLAACSSSSSSNDDTKTTAAAKESEKSSESNDSGKESQDESKNDEPSKTPEQTTEAETKPDHVDNFVPPIYEPTYVSDKPVTIEMFSQVANYSGEQTGWSAAVLKEKFNVIVNIINDPEGSQLTSRMQTGNLGDIIVFGNRGDQYETAAANGYLLNWNKDDLLTNYGPYMKEHFADALAYNASVNDGVCYGFSGSVAVEGSSNDQGTIYTWDTRWDLYDQLGQPEVKNLDDFLELMKKMKEICPTDDNGKETYALSMWPDWDGNMVMYVKALATAYFGYDEWGFGLYDVNTGNYHGALEEKGPYWESLKFINKLYQNGLVDPNSMSQKYQQMSEKLSAGGVFFSIFNYAGSGGFNSPEKSAENKMMLPLIPKDATPIVYDSSTQGTTYEWCIGAQTQYPELCMSILNWLSTPEGFLTYTYGPKASSPDANDGCWCYGEDGNLYLTPFGEKARADRTGTNMAEIGYTGTYNDGSLQVNCNTWSVSSNNPDSPTGEPFFADYWNSQQGPAACDVEQKWREYSGETVGTAYLLHWDKAVHSPATGITHKDPSKKSDLNTPWKAVAGEIVNGTWKCVYAKDDAEFDKLFEEMTKSAKAYGYDDCIEYSREQADQRFLAESILKSME